MPREARLVRQGARRLRLPGDRTAAGLLLALGALHQRLYKPIPGAFQGLHRHPQGERLPVAPPPRSSARFGSPIEVQIRTQDMHKIARPAWPRTGSTRAATAELNELQQKTHQWLQSLLEIQSESRDSIEFLRAPSRWICSPTAVYVFTAKGKILALPRGARPWISRIPCTPTSQPLRRGQGQRRAHAAADGAAATATGWRSSRRRTRGPTRCG